MAKLNGVNVIIPAVASISYNGAVYVQSGESAVKGDIIRIADNEHASYLTDGGYYEVTRVDSAGDPQINDDDDDGYDTASLDEKFVVFKRTETAAAPETSSDIVTHEGAQYRKVSRKVAPGDRFIIALKAGTDITAGKVYTITEIDSDGDPRFIDDDGDRNVICRESEYAVLEPLAEETVIYEGLMYRKLARKAVVGDLIYAIKRDHRAGDYEVGYITKTYDRNVDIAFRDAVGDSRELNRYGHDKNFVVLERIETFPTSLPSVYVIHEGSVYTKESRKANVGELVIILARRTHFIRVGEVVTCSGNGEFTAKESQFMDNRTCGFDQSICGIDQYAVLTPAESITLGSAVYNVEKRKAAVGEMILAIESSRDSRYAAGDIGRTTDGARIPDVTWNNGKENAISSHRYVVLVPKVTAEPVPQYVEVKRRANVGERIRIVAAELTMSTYANGDEFTVTSDFRGRAVRIDKDGAPCVMHEEYVVLEPVKESAKPAEPTEPVRLAVGTYGKIVSRTRGKGPSEPHNFDIGQTVKVTRWGVYTDRVRADSLDGNEYWYVYNGDIVAMEAPQALSTFKPGVKVRFAVPAGKTAMYGRAGIEDGTIGEVSRVRESDGLVTVIFPTHRNFNADVSELTVLDAEELAEIERKKAAKERLKVGEYARVIGCERGHGAEIGDIVKIVQDDDSGLPFECEKADGSAIRGGNWFVQSELERVSAAEVEEVAQAAKWSAIGRKVGEIKAGDIVKVTRSFSGHKLGSVGTAVDPRDTNQATVKVAGESCVFVSGVELIAPVESLFNGSVAI